MLIAVAFALVFTRAAPRHAVGAPVANNDNGRSTVNIRGPALVRVADCFNGVQAAIRGIGHRGVAMTQVLTQVGAGSPFVVYSDCNLQDVGRWAASDYALNAYLEVHPEPVGVPSA